MMKLLVAVALLCAAAVPVVPVHGAQWNIVAKDLLTMDMGVSFVNPTTGYTVGAANGYGPEVLKSTDGGHTWNACNATWGIEMLPLAIAADENTIVIGAIFGEMYSDDSGASFHQSLGGGHTQSVRDMKSSGLEHSFAAVISWNGTIGVAVSNDGGKLFKRYINPGFYTLGRYGAYPTASTWYVTAGSWPSESDDDMVSDDDAADDDFVSGSAGCMPQKFAFQDECGNYRGRESFVLSEKRPFTYPEGIYTAQLAKTTDGGATWTTLFAQNNTFYFNGIDCSPTNPDHCCAVGEAMTDSTTPGVRIYCTTDGTNFNRTFFAAATSTSGHSLVDIRFVSDSTIWALGTKVGVTESAWFLQSTDGGKTWDEQSHTIFGYLGFALDMVNANVGYASIIDTTTQESSIAKYVNV